ncbi:hypothetical protein GCM10010399_89420 [Dactylosporangium fulvum]
MRRTEHAPEHFVGYLTTGELRAHVPPPADDVIEVVAHDFGQTPAASAAPAGAASSREAGLRTLGSTPDRPPSRLDGQWLSTSDVGGGSPITAAGPCRFCTGFPDSPRFRGTSRQFVAVPTVKQHELGSAVAQVN